MIRLYHQNLAYHLRRAAENARSILIVTPYVKIRAIEAIIPRGIRFDELTLVTRGAPDDFASGISDLDALDAVWSLGGEVYRIPNLHAKYYRFDRIFFTGSANLTGRGIGVGLDQKWNDEVLASDFTSRESHELEKDWRMAAVRIPRNAAGELREFVERRRREGFLPDWLRRWAAQEAGPLPAGWLPACPFPNLLYEIFRGRDIRDLLPRDTDARFIQKLAAEDLAALVPPPALRSPEEMDLYIGTRLAGSPFLKTIQSLFRTETGPGRPFLSFGALKEMVRSPAFQAHIRAYDQVEVIARWLIYFLPDTYFIPSGLPFALGRRKRIPNGFRTEDQ